MKKQRFFFSNFVVRNLSDVIAYVYLFCWFMNELLRVSHFHLSSTSI